MIRTAPSPEASRAALLATVTERDFMAQVIGMAQLFGWRVFHVHDSRRSAAGYPDLTLVRRGELIFAELKTERGKVTAEQDDWLRDLRRVDGIEVSTCGVHLT